MKTLELREKQHLTEERLYDTNLQKCLSELENIVENLTGDPIPRSRPGSLKRQASQYLGLGADETLNKYELKKLRAKANKMKTSSKKEERDRGIQLARQVSFAYNMRD
jgi:hypothetical protein